MTTWLFFAILAPLLWGLPNVIDSILRRHYVKSDLALTWFTALVRLPVAIIFFLVVGIDIPTPIAIFFMLFGGMLWTLPFILYYQALKFEEPSKIALLLQLIPVFILILAFFSLEEVLTIHQGISFFLILIGGFFAALKRKKGSWRFSLAFWLIILACFLWAVSDVLFKKFEPTFNTFFNASAFFMLGSAFPALVILSLSKGRKIITHHFSNLPSRVWGYLTFSVASGISGSLSFAYALTLGKASLTAVILGIQPLFTLLFGILLAPFFVEVYREDISKKALLLKGFSFVLIILGLIYLQF